MVSSVVWSPDGKSVASADWEGYVRVWDVATGKQTAVFKGHTSWVTSVAWSPDGKKLASVGLDKTVRVWVIPAANQLQ
jgi:WD40 repeat protein